MVKEKEGQLRILQVHNVYRILGGEEQVVKNENKMLKNHGHKVWSYIRESKEIFGMKKGKKLFLPFTAVFSLQTYREVRKIIRRKKIQLVHVHNVVPLISPAVFYAAFAEHVPVVMTIHNFRLLCPRGTFYRNGQICEECVEKGLWCSVKYGCYRESRIQTLVNVLSIQLHRILGTYSRIYYICLTEFNKKKLLQLKQIKEDKVFVKPNYGCPVTGSDAHGRENKLIYAGRIEEEKGIRVLLEAYKELVDTDSFPKEQIPKLIICGEGSLKKECEEYVKRHRLGMVVFLGRVSNEEVKKLMAEAVGIVLPSAWYEGFSMNVVEGYNVRTPIIATDLGNLGNLIREGVNGWKFQAGDAKSLGRSIRKCISASCSFDLIEAKEWEEEGNYRKLIEIYERCIRDVRKAKEK